MKYKIASVFILFILSNSLFDQDNADLSREYQEPEYLMRGAHPFIAPDESYLIFDAQAEGRGKSQLFICFKDLSGNWTEAIKFDKKINATFTENIANVSPDGKYLFFHRNNDIYWVDANIIEE